jgi:hypothetical protein
MKSKTDERKTIAEWEAIFRQRTDDERAVSCAVAWCIMFGLVKGE